MTFRALLSYKSGFVYVLVFAFICVSVPAAFSQQEGQQKPPQSSYQVSGDATSSSVIVSPKEEYRIGASDVIDIQVVSLPEMTRTWRVEADGTIALPYLGIVRAADKPARQLAKEIADGLRGDYLVDPQVTVIVKQVNSRTFFIQGAVRSPGVYQITGRPSLLELITVAGGLSKSYGATAFIIRRVKRPEKTSETANPQTDDKSSGEPSESDGMPQFELIKANINGLLRGNFEQNIPVEPGDIVHIPETDVFFVAGEVKAPGSFPLKEGTTLRQAISLAQGTTFEAATGEGIIFRDDTTNGKREEIKVDIKDVMSGKKEDIAIRANDIIIVPNSRFKSVSGAFLRAFGLSAARAPVRY